MPKHSTYQQYWEEHEEALDDAIDVGEQLRDAVGRRDGLGRELKEAEALAPQERVTELREEYSRADGRVEALQKEFGDAQTKLGAIELDAAGVDPGWAASLEEGIAPDGRRTGEEDKSGKLDGLKAFVGEMIDRVKPAWEKLTEGHELGEELHESVIEPIKKGLEAAKEGAQNLAVGGAMLGMSVGGAASPDLMHQVENPTAGLQAGVERIVDAQAQLPPGVPLELVTNPHEAPKGPEAPDPVKEQQKFQGVQEKWDEEERKRDAEASQLAAPGAANWRSRPPPEMDDPLQRPAEAPPMQDHPGSLTAFEDPLEDLNEGLAELRQGMEESSLHQISSLPEVVESSLGSDPMGAFQQQAGDQFQDSQSGGLGRGPDSYASTDGPDIPAPLNELNQEPPPPPPPPPPEEDAKKGLGR